MEVTNICFKNARFQEIDKHFHVVKNRVIFCEECDNVVKFYFFNSAFRRVSFSHKYTYSRVNLQLLNI